MDDTDFKDPEEIDPDAVEEALDDEDVLEDELPKKKLLENEDVESLDDLEEEELEDDVEPFDDVETM